MVKSNYDVLIIGGSHAGLSAAMALGRLRRDTIVVDAGKPRNEVAEHANNIAGLDGTNPNDLRLQSRKDLEKYKTIDFIHDKVTEVLKNGNYFDAKLESGKSTKVRKVILAYGVKDQLPDIKGIWDLWGKSVFHCPYCHGFEFKDQKIGLIGNGGFADHLVPVMKNISDDLILFTQGESTVSPVTAAKLKKHNIPIVESPIKSIAHENFEIKSVSLSDNNEVKLQAILVGPSLPFKLNSNIGDVLGCEKDEMGFIKVSETGKTSAEGVFAAGDIMTMQQSVVGAAATGQNAGSAIVFELSKEDFEKEALK